MKALRDSRFQKKERETSNSNDDTQLDATEASKWIPGLSDLAFKTGPLIDFEPTSELTEADYVNLLLQLGNKVLLGTLNPALSPIQRNQMESFQYQLSELYQNRCYIAASGISKLNNDFRNTY